MRRIVSAALALSLVGHAFDVAAQDKAKAETGGPRKDPKGIKGISPFWEAIKKGDDALAARDVEGAKAGYQEAIRLEPQNPMGHYRLGEAELAKGNLGEAEAGMQSALRFSAQNPVLRGKALFVLADLKERQRQLDLAVNGWNAYADHAKAAPTAKTYPDTPVDRNNRVAAWKKLEADYGPVKDRIKARLEEAEKKAKEDAQSGKNK